MKSRHISQALITSPAPPSCLRRILRSLEWRISSFHPSLVLPPLFFLVLLASCPLMLIGTPRLFQVRWKPAPRISHLVSASGNPTALGWAKQTEERERRKRDRLVSAGQPLLRFTGE